VKKDGVKRASIEKLSTVGCIILNKLMETIKACVPIYPKPAVNISGGIDSTIVLHHLREKTNDTIRTYTIGFPETENEFNYARRVSDHYGTVHTEILIENLLDKYPEILKHFNKPRFNLWPYFLAKRQLEDDVENVYIGEGGDEHFGGYWYKPKKSYVEHWSSFFEYCLPTYQTIYDMFGLRLIIPLHPNNLNIKTTLPYYDYSQNKQHLKKTYKDILPKFVTRRRKQNGRFSYWVLWNRELKQYFPSCHPRSEDEIRNLLNRWVTREWLRSNSTNPLLANQKQMLCEKS